VLLEAIPKNLSEFLLTNIALLAFLFLLFLHKEEQPTDGFS